MTRTLITPCIFTASDDGRRRIGASERQISRRFYPETPSLTAACPQIIARLRAVLALTLRPRSADIPIALDC